MGCMIFSSLCFRAAWPAGAARGGGGQGSRAGDEAAAERPPGPGRWADGQGHQPAHWQAGEAGAEQGKLAAENWKTQGCESSNFSLISDFSALHKTPFSHF